MEKEVLVPEELCIDFIQKHQSKKAILLQLAEECNEVAQAALKLVRIWEGENPTPISENEALFNLHEELGDFFTCLDCVEGIQYNVVEGIEKRKLNRWCVRLSKFLYEQRKKGGKN